jgi:multiple sugar transport system permease protein
LGQPSQSQQAFVGGRGKQHFNMKRERKEITVGAYLTMVLLSFIAIFPFLFTLSAAISARYIGINSLSELIPKNPTLVHFVGFFNNGLFWRWMFNSFFVALIVCAGKIFIDSAAGYAIAKKSFFGRKAVINICLLTMAVPFAITFLPNFYTMNRLGWLNSYQALIIPMYSIPLGVFLAMQFMSTIPSELISAGQIDGCSEIGIYWKIIMPICKPLIGGIGLYYFLISWIDFLWPLIINTKDNMKVLPVAITAMRTQYVPNSSVSAALVVLSFFPITVIFLLLQKYFKQVIGMGAVKK